MKWRADIERVITWPASASELLRVHPSLGEALHDSDNAAVEAWLQAFLSGSGGNTELAGALATREWCYLGPVAFPLARLARCCGPEAEMAYHDPPASWEGRIARMAADIRAGWRPPPLIAGTFGG